jgi:hypothetical protein
MKLTVSRLKRLIREELSRVNEEDETGYGTQDSENRVSDAMAQALKDGPMYIDQLITAVVKILPGLSIKELTDEIDTITFDDTKGFTMDGDMITLL